MWDDTSYVDIATVLRGDFKLRFRHFENGTRECSVAVLRMELS